MKAHRVAIADSDTSFEVAPGERILTAALRAGAWIPFECGWGSCGTCKVTLVEGEVDTLFAEAPAISPRDARRNKVLACQTTPTSDLVIKPTWVEDSPRDGLAAERCAATLTTKDEIGPAIFRLGFTLEHVVPFREGQHAVIEVSDTLRRCYSMSNRPGTATAEFIMKRYDGKLGSETVSALSPGDDVVIEMPFGEMWLQDTDAPICLVAGGTGIAPILSRSPRRVAPPPSAIRPRPPRRSRAPARTASSRTCAPDWTNCNAGCPGTRPPAKKWRWRDSASAADWCGGCWPPVSRDCRRPSRSTDQSRTTPTSAARKMLRCLGSTAPSTIG